jgi:hypothetical protein
VAAPLHLRACEIGDVDSLVAFDQALGRPASSASYWRWKYFANPAGSACLIVAVDEGRIVGQLGVLPIRMRVGGRVVIAGQQVDAEILPEHRGGGLYFQMAELVGREGAARQIAFGLGFATEETKHLSVEFLGFSLVGPVGRFVRVLDYGHYLNNMLGGPAHGALAWLRSRSRGRSSSDAPPLEDGVMSIDRFDDRFDQLAEHLDLASILTVRDSTYLNWRYADCPIVAYRRFAVQVQGILRGFVVFHRARSEGASRGILDELVCAPGDTETAERLLSTAIQMLALEGAVNVTCWLPPCHPLADQLRAGGFRSREARTSLIVVPQEQAGLDVEHLRDERSWYYMLGDSDYHMRPGGERVEMEVKR